MMLSMSSGPLRPVAGQQEIALALVLGSGRAQDADQKKFGGAAREMAGAIAGLPLLARLIHGPPVLN